MHTDRFSECARSYARTRPQHPPAAVDYVLDDFGSPADFALCRISHVTLIDR
jgi:hypothetical protein